MGKMQKKQVGFLVFLMLSLIIIGASLMEFFKPIREKYSPINFEDNSRWVASFLADYKKAIVQGDDWVKHAETVALRVAGYPNEDKIRPEKIYTETTKDGVAVVTILSQEAMDDSISREETRVELLTNGSTWKISWAGNKRQCRRDLFDFGGTSSFCS